MRPRQRRLEPKAKKSAKQRLGHLPTFWGFGGVGLLCISLVLGICVR